MKWKWEKAAEMQRSIEISWWFGTFHGFFVLKVVQMIGECVVYSCINLAMLGFQRKIWRVFYKYSVIDFHELLKNEAMEAFWISVFMVCYGELSGRVLICLSFLEFFLSLDLFCSRQILRAFEQNEKCDCCFRTTSCFPVCVTSLAFPISSSCD